MTGLEYGLHKKVQLGLDQTYGVETNLRQRRQQMIFLLNDRENRSNTRMCLYAH